MKYLKFCINCNNEIKCKNKYTRKYCCKTCQHEYQWSLRKTKIIEGYIFDIRLMKKFLEEQEYICKQCGNNGKWNDKKLVLEIDHIDGNSDNNNLNNLRLLCPNCHSQTKTYTGRNKKNTKRNNYLRKYKRGQLV